MNSIAIIGAGLGGLSAAVLLSSAGFKVDVYEKHTYPGGKMRRFTVGGARFDFGPNTITMPEVFRNVFKKSGVNPEDYVLFKKIDPHTKNVFADGSVFISSTNRDEMIKELTVFGESEQAYDRYIKSVTALFSHSIKQFFPRTFSSLIDFISPALLSSLVAVKPLQKMDAFHRSFFVDNRIVQMLNRYATYIGSSPYQTPATFAMIGYLELVDGVYYVEGGNPTIAEALHKRAVELGVTFHFDNQVKRFHTSGKRVEALECMDRSIRSYDSFLLNGDFTTVYPKLIKKSERPAFKLDKQTKEPTSSALVILAATSKKTAASFHHQVYFSNDYRKEFEDLFAHKRYSDEPTIYICNSSVNDLSAVSETGGDNLFILVNAPSLTVDNMNCDIDAYKEKIYDLLEEKGVVIRPHLIEEKIITPEQIQMDFQAYFGGLYGLSSHSLSQAFIRPSVKTRDFQNLYFAGGSTHPGGGSPMVVQSGTNAANLIINEHK